MPKRADIGRIEIKDAAKQGAGFLIGADRQKRFGESQPGRGAIGVVFPGPLDGEAEGRDGGVAVAGEESPGAEVGPARLGGVQRLGPCQANIGVGRELVGQQHLAQRAQAAAEVGSRSTRPRAAVTAAAISGSAPSRTTAGGPGGPPPRPSHHQAPAAVSTAAKVT